MTTTEHPYGPTVLRVIAVNLDPMPMDCEDTDTAHVWVKVPGWTPRRAFLTGARPFAQAAECEPADLVGRIFIARLNLDAVPGNDDTAGERLDWPDLREAPPLPEEWTQPAESPTTIADADNPTHLRWGLNDVMWGDDDSVIVLLSGPGGEPYWLELDPERAAALREDLAGPGEDPAPAEEFTGTQSCGHDDYHDPHEWADRPGVWCPGHSFAAEETHVVADDSDDPEHVDDCPGRAPTTPAR